MEPEAQYNYRGAIINFSERNDVTTSWPGEAIIYFPFDVE
jgi:hypothetical protein